MNVGMILDASFPPDPRVENEAATLIERGHNVYLYSLDYTHARPQSEVINGLHVDRQWLPRYVYRLSALAYTIPYYHAVLEKSIAAFIRRHAIEALHIHDIQVARSVFRVNKAFKLPVVLDLHENRPEIMKYYAHVQSLPGRVLIFPSVWKKYEYRYIRAADRVVVVTREARDYYVRHLPIDADKFCVVPNTVRKAFYTDYRLDQGLVDRYADSFTVLYLGDTGLRRGLETMIQSLDHLVREIPTIKLVLVGSSKTDALLRKQMAEAGYESYVDLEGWQDFGRFPSYILASDVCVSPLHKNIHHETTYANKLFQYMAFGKPVVVSDCKAQANLVERYDCGLVFKDRDVEDFAAKILTLYRDEALRQRLSEHARTAVREALNWETTSADLVNLYDAL